MMRQRLLDVLQSCQSISEYTAGLNFADYLVDPMVRDAVERRIGIIGEALNRAVELDPALGDQISEFRQIIGLCNRVIHGYDGIDDEIIWDIVRNKLPLLQTRVEAILEGVE